MPGPASIPRLGSAGGGDEALEYAHDVGRPVPHPRAVQPHALAHRRRRHVRRDTARHADQGTISARAGARLSANRRLVH